MNPSPHVATEEPLRALQLVQPDPRTVYTIEAAAYLVDVPRHTILVYYKHGLVSPVVDPACGGYFFNDEAIRLLRRIHYLRTVCGINVAGIKMILELTSEVERLQAEVRFLRRL
ncbi:MAG: MerR family transcriptional regulator [Verrucomicrobia bacterium]|nr:MerR family transcriptional regulator [Verrucomicrobiota bacterium]